MGDEVEGVGVGVGVGEGEGEIITMGREDWFCRCMAE